MKLKKQLRVVGVMIAWGLFFTTGPAMWAAAEGEAARGTEQMKAVIDTALKGEVQWSGRSTGCAE